MSACSQCCVRAILEKNPTKLHEILNSGTLLSDSFYFFDDNKIVCVTKEKNNIHLHKKQIRELVRNSEIQFPDQIAINKKIEYQKAAGVGNEYDFVIPNNLTPATTLPCGHLNPDISNCTKSVLLRSLGSDISGGELALVSLLFLALECKNTSYLELLCLEGHIDPQKPLLYRNITRNIINQSDHMESVKTDMQISSTLAINKVLKEHKKEHFLVLARNCPAILDTWMIRGVELIRPLEYILLPNENDIEEFRVETIEVYFECGRDLNGEEPFKVFKHFSFEHNFDCFEMFKLLIELGSMNFSLKIFQIIVPSLVFFIKLLYHISPRLKTSLEGKSKRDTEEKQEREINEIIRILLSLGYGRNGPLIVDDHVLIMTRECFHYSCVILEAPPGAEISLDTVYRYTQYWLESNASKNPIAIDILRNALAKFDLGPLSLKEISRNTIRWAIRPVNFKQRALHLPLPESLKNFIIYA